ncbi:pyridoxamine 5'-phosphate oxidase family protein [Kineococcus endophyticus]|uniref:Pyridoxamine 5'-phosphate oxidase family protein n=1 Tax=Kineococcus endophyticus TaxID=1181883 RepID=A0ABV3P9H2_9ACTN
MTNDPSPGPRWSDVEAGAPELARAVLARFGAARHHVLATLSRDGSPRVWGTEVDSWHGDLLLGSMVPARKLDDLRRDPRFALHAHTGDGSMADGDAKVSGRAVVVTDPDVLAAYTADRHPPEPYVLLRLHPTAVVLTELDGERLRITSWRDGAGPRTVVR